MADKCGVSGNMLVKFKKGPGKKLICQRDVSLIQSTANHHHDGRKKINNVI